MTKKIISPLPSAASSDHHLDCQLAIEPAFLELLVDAEKAGWPRFAVAYAAIDIILSHLIERERLSTKQISDIRSLLSAV